MGGLTGDQVDKIVRDIRNIAHNGPAGIEALPVRLAVGTALQGIADAIQEMSNDVAAKTK